MNNALIDSIDSLAELQKKATAGPWQCHALLLEPADLAQLGRDNDQCAVGLKADMPNGPRRVVALCGPLNDSASRMSAAFIAKAGSLDFNAIAAALRAATAAPVAGSREGEALTDLVERFSAALLAKLQAARVKYGYEADGFLSTDWETDCLGGLLQHVDKGDPRDVAAYCAFMWHHGWSTTPSPTILELRKIAAAAPVVESKPAGGWALVLDGLPEDGADPLHVLGRWEDGDVRRCQVYKGELSCGFPARGGYPVWWMPEPIAPSVLQQDGFCVACQYPRYVLKGQHWGGCSNDECAAFKQDMASASYLMPAAPQPHHS